VQVHGWTTQLAFLQYSLQMPSLSFVLQFCATLLCCDSPVQVHGRLEDAVAYAFASA
jgi:hypothetical protein